MDDNFIKYVNIPDDGEYSFDAPYLGGVSASGYQSKGNLVTSLSGSSETYQYPSAKCIYTIVGDLSIFDDSSETEELENTVYYDLILGVTAGLGMITGAESGSYPAGTSFTITAVPNGSTFTGWSDKVTDVTRTIVMNSDITLIATFQLSSNIDDPGEVDYPTLDDLID